MVAVYGDTNTPLVGALAAAKIHVSAAHVEVGPRSFNQRMLRRSIGGSPTMCLPPFFFPTEAAIENLRREGFTNILNAGHLLPLDYA